MQTFGKILIALIIYLVGTGCSNKANKNIVSNIVTNDSVVFEIPFYEKIFEAIEKNDFVTFKELIQKDIQLDILLPRNDDETYTILGYCCEYKRCQWVEYLLNQGIEPDPACGNEYYEFDALYISVPKEDICTTKFLLNSNANPNRRYNEEGLTALYMSCQAGNFDLSALLIEHGGEVNGLGYTEGTDYVFYPLMAAVHSGNMDLVKLLLENGADAGVIDRQGMTPMKVAETNEMRELLSGYLNSLEANCRDSIFDYGTGQICSFADASFNEIYSDVIKNELVDDTALLIPTLPEEDRIVQADRNGLIQIEYTIKPDESKILMCYEGGETVIRIWKEDGKIWRTIFFYAD